MGIVEPSQLNNPQGTDDIRYNDVRDFFRRLSFEVLKRTLQSSGFTDGEPGWRLGNLNGVGGKTFDTDGILLGDYTNGKYLMYDEVSGDLIVNNSILSNNNIFGDGSDGDVTIGAGTTTLTSDMFYNNLTIQTGGILNPNGFRIFVKNTLTFEGTGKIAVNGGAGGNGTNGQIHTNAPVSQAGGAAGAAAHASGSLPGSPAGKAGGGGGGDGSAGTCTLGGVGTNGDAATKALAGIGSNAGVAGEGNGGCTVVAATGSAGAISGTVFNKIRNVFSAYQLLDNFPAVTAFSIASGSASGAGGTSGRNDPALTKSGGGGGGGGSGAGGGIAWVSARLVYTVAGNNYIEAKGGAGGNGGNGGTSDDDVAVGGGGGGGGGGRGGVIIEIYSRKTGTGTTSVTGGAKGTAGTSGGATDGVVGGNGVVVSLVV